MARRKPTDVQLAAGWVPAHLTNEPIAETDITAKQPPKAQVMDGAQRRRLERLREKRLLDSSLRDIWDD